MSEAQLANGRFTIQRRIGAGGMGVVYEAFDRDRRHVVALKKLLGTDASAIYRLKNEFRALADVVHPNLVRLYELIGEGDDWFFTMELVDGTDFLHAIRGRNSDLDATTERSTLLGEKDTGQLPPLRERPDIVRPDIPVDQVPIDYVLLRRTLRQLGEGVSALHDAGKLHRDIKPSNVLVTPAGRVVILDFGLTTDVSPFERKMTFGGTPAYMAPEQIAEMPPTEASDCYAIGVMLYEALTGTLPFSGNFYSMLMQKRSTDPKPPLELSPDVPEDLSRLCIDLLRRAPEDRLSARELVQRVADHQERAVVASVSIPRPRDTPFVGRLHELEQLEEAYAATERGAPVTVLVRGQSGMGKTALVRAFLYEVQQRDRNVVVFSGRSYEQESVPYKAVDSLIDDLARYLRRVTPLEAKALMPTDVAALARLFPVLQELAPVAKARRKTVEIRDSQELRRRAFAALREMFARMTDEHRVILFVDDVQWGDRDSAALLAEILRPPDAPPLLLIAAHRPEEDESSIMLAELRKLRAADNALGDVREIALDRLSRDEARDLAKTMMHHAGAQASDERFDAIVRDAGGSPFFIVELARFAETAGLEAIEGGGKALDHLIRSRIALLPEVARDLLEIVSVAGRPILATAANVAANLRPDDEAMLARLRADHLLRTRVRAGRDEVDTYHDRIREAILATLSSQRRRARHLEIARTLEAHGAGDPEVLAVHYMGAGEPAKAAVHAREAGERAASALAFDNAAHFFAMAAGLQTEEPGAELMIKLADALSNAGRSAEAARHYLRASERVPESEKLEMLRRASEGLLRSGHVDDGLRIIHTVLGAVGLKLPSSVRNAIIGIILGKIRLKLRGLNFTERPLSEIPKDEIKRVEVAYGMTTGLARIDNIRAAYFQPIHLRLALDAGDPQRVARAVAVEACFSATFGENSRKRTRELVIRAEQLARRTGDAHSAAMAALAQSLESYYIGRFLDAYRKAEEAETIFRERCIGAAWEINTSMNYSLCSQVFLGELAQLAPRVIHRLREAEERGDLYAGIDPVCRPGIIWLAADEPDTGRRALRQVMDRWSLEGFHYQHYLELFAQTQIDLYKGEGLVALGRIDEKWPAFKSTFLMRMPFSAMEARHLRSRSLLAAAMQTNDLSLLARVEHDAARIQRINSTWSYAFASALRAGALAMRGQKEEAADLLGRASRAFERTEMLLYARAAAYRRGELLGGEEGRALKQTSQTWLETQGVKNVAKMADVLVPGIR
jgi:eukaryotic-like serine/threonine-protein kinase